MNQQNPFAHLHYSFDLIDIRERSRFLYTLLDKFILKKPLIKKSILLLLSLIFIFSCNEDKIDPINKGALTGKVIQSSNGAPIAGVSITTSPPSGAVITSEEGVFEILNVKEGSYSVSAKKEGFDPVSVTIAIDKNITNEVTIILSNDGASSNLFDVILPADEATEQPITTTLKWSAVGNSDSLTYTVFLFESNSLKKTTLISNSPDTSLVVEGLKYNTTYFWQVEINDGNNVKKGEVLSFKTASFPVDIYLFTRGTNGNFDIYSSTDTSSSVVYKLTDSPAREWYPVLSPDRTLIAYSSTIDIEPNIYVMNVDGSNKNRVTSTYSAVGYNNNGIGFCWSPDGKKILYSHYNRLFKINRDGSDLTEITRLSSNMHFRECDWSGYTGKIVALAIGQEIYNSEIYIMNENGTEISRVLSDLPGQIASPTFSVDGEKIMFTRDFGGFNASDGRQLDSRIFIMNKDGSNILDISGENKPTGTNDLYPRFSSNGAKIIFNNESNDGIQDPEVWIMDVDGSNRVKLFSNALMPEF